MTLCAICIISKEARKYVPPDNSKCCARRHLQIPTTYPLARVLCIYKAVAAEWRAPRAVGQTFEVVPVTVCIYGGPSVTHTAAWLHILKLSREESIAEQNCTC